MHNNIMEAGSRDRPPMLATGRYLQWRSRFLRYIDTRPNGDALRKCILSGPYKPTTVLVKAVAATDDSSAIPEHTTIETPMNMSPKNKAHFQEEKEAIHLILTGIGDEIYSTKEVNELRAKRLARNANQLALVATTQANQDPYYQTSRPHKSCAPSLKPSISTRTHTTTIHKGKEIARPITPPSETASEEVNNPEQARRDKDMQKNLALIAKYFKKIYKPANKNLKTSSNSRNKNVDTIPRKPKRVKDFAYYKEKMLLCKQAEQSVPLQAEQYDWLAKTNEGIDEQELEAHYSYVAKIQEVPTADSGTDSEPLEQTEFKKYKAFNDRTIDYDKLERKLNEALGQLALEIKEDQFRVQTAQDIEILIHTCLMPLAIKNQNDSFILVHELKQEMHVDLKYIESLKKEIDRLESDKAEFSNMYDTILQECVTNDVMCSYLLSLSDLDMLAELKCLYLHKVKECDYLAQKLSNQTESVSKEIHTDLLQCFAKVEKHSISLEIALQKYLKAQLQDKNIAISELIKLIEKGKGKSMESKFDKPSVVRQPNPQRIPKPSVLRKPAPFLNSLERRYFPKQNSVPKTNVSEGLSKPVTAHTLPQTERQAVSNTNVLKPGIPQHRSNQLKDKVLPNNSQVKLKKTQVEEHPRIFSMSKPVTACNDSLNSRTSNVNAAFKKYLVDSDHFACVTKMLNDVNAKTKKPNVVPISTRKPKGHANKSVATLYKKKVASKSTNQKPQSYFRMLYEKTSKTWKWWIEQQSSSRYQWVPKTKMKLVPKAKNENVHKRVSFAVNNASRITNVLKRTNSLGSNLSTVPSLSHLNFDYINLLSKKDVVIGLPKLKYVKDQLCSSCELSKVKRSSFKSKDVPSSKGRLDLLHMDLCGPLRVASINRKKYILVIVDYYSRYTWTLFLHFKDETLEVLKDFSQ
uniref:Retrovirus-related Pol polyprotein from transposon TNT 1-94 n=1 Tax=Tanacetum cinerariifolium TaxID=118510 RepID=A0A699HWU5_TANCI|nr:retrovirus-related Pol polyprotein from transposon TNT 1-94 [Tanacetum cinerariifolium]